MAAAGVDYVPTISGIATVTGRIRASGRTTVADALEHRVLKPLRRSIALAASHGVRIGTGTDTLGDIHQEMQWLNALGLSRHATLCAATVHAAAIGGASRHSGQLSEGFRADCLVVHGDPLADVAVLETPAAVMVGGVCVQ